MKVIGLVGPIASGKDEAASYISKKLGISSFPVSSCIKEVARQRGISIHRENLVLIGDELSKRFGEEYLARYLIEKYPGQDLILTGMRVPAQIDYLRKFDFILISIDADPKIRFGRAKSRGKHLEADTYQEFVELEEKENSGDFSQSVFKVMDMADHHITNNGTLEEFHKKLDNLTSYLK